MVLSDRSIKKEIEQGRVVVSPLDPGDIQPASIDLHLDRKVLVFTNSRQPYIDVKESLEGLTEMVEIPEDNPFILHPGEFVLSSRAVERMGAALLQGLNSGGVQAATPGGGATLTIEPASAQHLADMFQRDPGAADRGLMAVVRSGGRFSRALRG